MNINELRDKIMKNIGLSVNDGLKLVNLFSEYEQSNKSEELPKETKDLINLWKEIETIKDFLTNSNIVGMKKEIFEQYAYTKKYIACIDECRAEIAELKQAIIMLENKQEKPASEPKQERYTMRYSVIDGSHKIYDNGRFLCEFSNPLDMNETCRLLSSLEALK